MMSGIRVSTTTEGPARPIDSAREAAPMPSSTASAR